MTQDRRDFLTKLGLGAVALLAWLYKRGIFVMSTKDLKR